ncbi:hypothetical protein J2Z40_003193 [Cytobacillus eiseniae]|uniref:Uncharacterized protein n=1 Tax=Cytobacillus eiseniae TaxID=762947 RepID=A0ABS4RIC5_9BACI|nr:hypothetical protein [Cytobacillus eiseniae]MBP2242616.1 hypothetical protein [Cytobacillus eiseniae]
MDKNKSGKKAFMSMRKRVITGVAILVIGTSTTVAASQDTGYFNEFFGGGTNGFVKDTHDQEVVQSGIKMKIEESLSAGKSALTTVSFEKEDGTGFPEGALVSNLELDVKHGASYMVEQQLTEDHKKIIVMFDIDTLSSLEGKGITIKADAIVNDETDKVIANGPFKNKFTAKDRSDKTDIDLTLKQQNEEVVLKTIYVSAIGIGIEGERMDGQSSYLPEISPIVKVMTKDNQIIELSTSSTSSTDNGFKWQYSLDSEGNRIFLDKSAIKNIMINNHKISIGVCQDSCRISLVC